MNSTKYMGTTAGVMALALCTLGISQSLSSTGLLPSDFSSPGTGIAGGAIPTVETRIGLVGEAASFRGTHDGKENFRVETAVHVYNDSPGVRMIKVLWIEDGGGGDNIKGVSGPIPISPGQSHTLTSNTLGTPRPWPLDSWAERDSAGDFTGRAIILSDPGGYRGIAFNAFRICGVGSDPATGQAEEIQSIPVYKIKFNGLGRQAGD